MSKRILILLLIILTIRLDAQDTVRSWQLDGHIQALETVWIPPSGVKWQTMSQLYNRLEFEWQPLKALTFNAAARNIFDYGQMVEAGYPEYGKLASHDDGLMDLTWLWVQDTSYFFYTNIDRLNLMLKAGKFEATVGRQRINWAINMVWTPNDIFNSYNYFDFDYVERPGCDAVLLQYYTGNTSSVQFALKVDRHLYALDSTYWVTSALMYRFNKWNYDFQFLGGVMREDAVAGLGWSGNIKGAGFNGEASYFLDKKQLFDTTGAFVGSMELNYMLKNGIFLQGGYLYNSAGTTGPAGWGTALVYTIDVSAKNFTKARNSLFASVSYPFNPLFQGSVATIFNPNDKSGFVGPSIDLSLTQNISLFAIAQVFWGQHMTEYGDYGTLLYWRLKWSF